MGRNEFSYISRVILADACDNFSLVILTLECDVLWGFVTLLLLQSYKDHNSFFSSLVWVFLNHLQLCILRIIQVHLAFAVVLEIKPNAERGYQIMQ